LQPTGDVQGISQGINVAVIVVESAALYSFSILSLLIEYTVLDLVSHAVPQPHWLTFLPKTSPLIVSPQGGFYFFSFFFPPQFLLYSTDHLN
jgi:hypothetical protein